MSNEQSETELVKPAINKTKPRVYINKHKPTKKFTPYECALLAKPGDLWLSNKNTFKILHIDENFYFKLTNIKLYKPFKIPIDKLSKEYKPFLDRACLSSQPLAKNNRKTNKNHKK